MTKKQLRNKADPPRVRESCIKTTKFDSSGYRNIHIDDLKHITDDPYVCDTDMVENVSCNMKTSKN